MRYEGAYYYIEGEDKTIDEFIRLFGGSIRNCPLRTGIRTLNKIRLSPITGEVRNKRTGKMSEGIIWYRCSGGVQHHYDFQGDVLHYDCQRCGFRDKNKK